MRSVATRNAQKLNWLIRSIPPGMVVDAAWLTAAGYSTSLRSQYMDVLVDAFGDSHGIDTAETVATMKGIASLDHIGTVERVADGDASAPVQVADLIGYTRFRLEMMAGGHIRADRALAAIAPQRDGVSVTSANIPHKVRLRHGDLRAVAIPLHYALARAFVAARDPVFAETYLVGVAELRDRLHAVIAREPVGVSILTDAARTHPPPYMAKTPD